jgi:pyruvate,water dikinase
MEREEDIVSEVSGEVLEGLPASPGIAEGPAAVLTKDLDLDRVEKGSILICAQASVRLSILLPRIKGMAADQGGILASAYTLAREYGIPAVTGTLKGTELIQDGDLIRIDGSRGRVEILEKAPLAERDQRFAKIAEDLQKGVSAAQVH